MRFVGGVDEAGRGPIIGPMVIALVVTDDMDKVKRLGVRDSKELSPRGREQLFNILKSVLNYMDYEVIGTGTIDEYVYRNALNKLEAEVTVKLITKAMGSLRLYTVYVDSPDPRAERYGELIRRGVNGDVEIVSMNKADKLIPIVSAASIIAKVIRDTIINELHREYGDFGSGYPSDPRTIRFLKNWVREHGDLPPIVRRSWSTVKKILGGLDNYI
ncbi:ribonuclease HII [Vulcanisaeta souniana]|uniref:Ribonuclease HII n=1 Tax=Vulcanisaeta souniana JCM 11219 TaxID=1293586 RepID=A0A830EJ95_9CREN|nr:ribonuclease HII [Vulcanisaeta souniana]BDR92767.1 ribonuclease HII [Vulcanisaeta souniana JCM 11219]GGI82291.1 ribonuclease HII [Vulcanisaeta souniana JCM 11219]